MSAGIKFKLGPPEDDTVPPLIGRDQDAARAALSERFETVRHATTLLSAPLAPEDQVIQSMADVSPTKWHLAHTTWFFETFLLQRFSSGYEAFNEAYAYLFNSYYYTVGQMYERPCRGLISRPTVTEVARYRAHVDAMMQRLIQDAPASAFNDIAFLTEVGLHHEQQHQELMLTDIKHVLSCNPIKPGAYQARPRTDTTAPQPMEWIAYDDGIHKIGHRGDGFAFDNEGPHHDELIRPFSLASRPVTNGEYLDFIEDKGYSTVTLWLSDAWATIQTEGWRSPLYWLERDGVWHEFTLSGLKPLDLNRPVAHVSFYEAQAFATWAGNRLPTEFELEVAASRQPIAGNLLRFETTPGGDGARTFLAPEPAAARPGTADALAQLFGDVWEWTQSPYAPYPGFKPLAGSLGEYNGKFMCNQFVLRGGSCATPADHIRPTYRNFFPPDARWQFSGLRLAADRV